MDISADTAARAIHERWFPLFGVPHVLRSDRAPAFAGSLMQAFRKLVGIKHWDFSAAHDPRHHSLLERRHAIIDSVLDPAVRKGDLTSGAALRIYTATANHICNLEHTYEGYTPYQFLTGDPPRTRVDLLKSDPLNVEAVLDDKSADTHELIRHIREITSSFSDWSALERDDASRYSSLQALDKAGRAQTTKYVFRPGDHVSYDGELHMVKSHSHFTAEGPVKATVAKLIDGTAETKLNTVNITDLLPLSTQRPANMVSPKSAVPLDSFVFATDDSGDVFAGTVTDIDNENNSCTIHVHQQGAKQKRRFTPLYFHADMTAHPHVKVPSNPNPKLVHTPTASIMAVGDISSSYFIDESLLATVLSKGVVEYAIQPNIAYPALFPHSPTDAMNRIVFTGLSR